MAELREVRIRTIVFGFNALTQAGAFLTVSYGLVFSFRNSSMIGTAG